MNRWQQGILFDISDAVGNCENAGRDKNPAEYLPVLVPSVKVVCSYVKPDAVVGDTGCVYVRSVRVTVPNPHVFGGLFELAVAVKREVRRAVGGPSRLGEGYTCFTLEGGVVATGDLEVGGEVYTIKVSALPGEVCVEAVDCMGIEPIQLKRGLDEKLKDALEGATRKYVQLPE